MAAKKRYVVIAIAIATILMAALFWRFFSQAKLSETTDILGVNLKLYQNSGCTMQLTTIDWGDIASGGSSTQRIYAKNEGTLPMTLNMTASDSIPSDAKGCVRLSWNRENYVLVNQTSIDASLTIEVSSTFTTSTDLYVNVTITRTEQP